MKIAYQEGIIDYVMLVGVTTSIMSSGIPAYAQPTYSQSGHSTLTVSGGTVTQTFNGNLKCAGRGPQGSSVNGGGTVTCISGNVVTVQGSPGFKAQASRTC